MALKTLMWMVLSLACFAIFNAYRYIEDKELNIILLVGIYMLIGVFAFYKMSCELYANNLFGKQKLVHYIWITNGLAVPISIFFVYNYPKLTNYLVTQFVILTIVGMLYVGYKELKKKAKKKKSLKSDSKS